MEIEEFVARGMAAQEAVDAIVVACPNDSCEHSAYVHDIESLTDRQSMCCIDDCSCGRRGKR